MKYILHNLKDENEKDYLQSIAQQYKLELYSLNSKMPLPPPAQLAFALLDCHQDHSNLPPDLPTIALAGNNKNDALEIMRLNPSNVLLRPYAEAEVSVVFNSIIGKYNQSQCFPAKAHNLVNVLKRIVKELEEITHDDRNKQSFADSLLDFCKEECRNATCLASSATTKDVAKVPDSVKNLHLISIITGRGIVFCAHNKDCQLYQFRAWGLQNKKQLMEETVFKSLVTPIPTPTHFMEFTKQALAKATLISEEMMAIKYEYCTKVCTMAEKMPPQKAEGTLLSTDLKEIMKTNTILFCRHSDCPMNQLYCMFMKKVK